MDSNSFNKLVIKYNYYINNVKSNIGNINATYGLQGIAAPWLDLEGGADQYLMPFNGKTLKALGILEE